MSDIKSEAASWAVRVDAGPLDEARRVELESWLAGDPRRRGAFLRAQAGLRLLDQSRVVSQVLPPPAALKARRGRGMAPRVGWTLAATAAGLCAAILMLTSLDGFRTQVGEQRRVALRDGSVAMINTDSNVAVHLAKHQRRITLRHGEAWFQVAKDHARPFVVDAGPIHVRATGTAFSVRREDDGARVVVTEGTVLAWRDGARVAPLAISAGHEAFIAKDAPLPAQAKPSRTEDVLAWRRGEIVLNGGTIASAVEEFNRYNTRKIVLRDPAAGRRTIVGYFLIDQPQQFALAAARMTRGKMIEGKTEIVIEHSQ
jgi:transmembrane sensor